MRPRGAAKEQLTRFERSGCNELWQCDIKGLGSPHPGYYPLSVIDDCSRFGLSFFPLEDKRSATIFARLWDLFGLYGLPEAMLFDNEACFASHFSLGPCGVEAPLWRLGIRTSHTRPFHPQTQGKVERFHGTAQEWLGKDVRPARAELARANYQRFLEHYNWERPHEALGFALPGERYQPSSRQRPSSLPEHQIPEGALTRKVDAGGAIWLGGRRYCVSAGLAGERVVICEEDEGRALYYAGRRFAVIA